jgi:hypothetical protein
LESRWGRLALEAHLTGIHFDGGRYDRRYLLREQLVFSALEDKLVADVNRLAHIWHCSAAKADIWDEKKEDFEFHRKEANRTFRAIGKSSLPWYSLWQQEELTLENLYKSFRAMQKDPEYIKRREAIRAKMNEKIATTKADTANLQEVFKKVKAEKAARERKKHGRLHR